MPRPIAPAAEILSRLRSGRFWTRWLVGLLAGHIAGALGFAVVFVALLELSPVRRAPTALDASVGWQIAWLPFKLVLGIGAMFPPTVLLMAPLSLAASPATLLAAAVLQTDRWRTTLLGAVVGVTVGWPLARILWVGLIDAGWIWAACSAGAGALFALAVWHISMRPWIAPAEPAVTVANRRRVSPLLAVLALLLLIGLALGA